MSCRFSKDQVADLSMQCTSDGCVASCCPISATECDAGSQFLMSPTADPGEHDFSPCSVGNICQSSMFTRIEIHEPLIGFIQAH